MQTRPTKRSSRSTPVISVLLAAVLGFASFPAFADSPSKADHPPSSSLATSLQRAGLVKSEKTLPDTNRPKSTPTGASTEPKSAQAKVAPIPAPKADVPSESAPDAATSLPAAPELSSPALETTARQEDDGLAAPLPPGTVLSSGTATTEPSSWKGDRHTNGFRLRPNLAFNFRKGYKRTLGPAIMLDGRFNDTQIKLEVSYLPLRFQDADGQIAYTQASLRLMRFFGDKIFVRASAGMHWFKPDGSLTDFVRTRGATISSKAIPSWQIGAGYKLTTFRFRFWGKKREIPLFATADYTWMDKYRFGLPIGDAGDSLRMGKDLRLGFQLMMRKF